MLTISTPDEERFRLAYHRHAGAVWRYLARRLGDDDLAEDLTSEVFARLPRALGLYRPGATPFAAWLLRVARNAALDHLRRERSVPSPHVHPAGEPPGPHELERLAGLRSALAALPADQRQVVLLRLVAGLSPHEVADKLDRSVDAVHALQHRARRRLRRDLTALGFAPAG